MSYPKLVPNALDPAKLRVIKFEENEVVFRFNDGGHIVIRPNSTGDLIVDSSKKKNA